MKSIKQQYIDLMEGRMSQHNFMRSLRMTMPQYVTNVTSFKDSVRILKNKGILSEAMDIKDEDEEFIDMIAKAEEEEAGKYTKFDDFEGGLSEAEEIKIDGKVVADYKQNGDKSYSVEFEDGSKKTIAVSNDNWDVINNIAKDKLDEYEHTYRKIDGVCYKIDDEGNRTRVADHYCRYGEGLNEGKGKELHPNQIHPQELRMGIKVELEHTKVLDKAKKIALDHLAENPFYYTALKLSGIESPSSPKVKAPKEAKKGKADAVELVDKINAMKPVKGFEKAKASSNKAKKETNSGVKGVSELTHNAQTVRGLQKFAATGGKMKTIRENQLNEGGEWTITGTLTKDEQDELKTIIGDYDLDVQATDDTLETTISHPTYNDKTLEHALKQVRGMLPQKKQFGYTAGFGNVLQSK